jgi:dolichyl-phosphate-mannose-protein mannosyltransferase
MFGFFLHFSILHRSGDGDATMPSLFQAQLLGNHFYENPLEIMYGSKVTIKNNGYGGTLLHSHVQRYPSGSKQQQITCYGHKDSNNNWFITYGHGFHGAINESSVNPIRNHDVIRLNHENTKSNLHSHKIAAPVTKRSFEVSGYGVDGNGDEKDNWVIEIVDDTLYPFEDPNTARIKSLTTRFRLRHQVLGCYLVARNVNLPEWGFKQTEVTCERGSPKDSNSLWNIEQHWNDKLPPGRKDYYRRDFLQDFIHLNVAMWSSNNALVPDPDKLEPDILASVPSQWPLCSVGLRMCGWDDSHFKVYLLGNPFIWWTGAFSLVLFCAFYVILLLRFKRGCSDVTPETWKSFKELGFLILGGWVLHFVPFVTMSRVTYLHHYFPALYFAMFMTSFLLDFLTKSLKAGTQSIIFGFFLAVTAAVFLFFSPLSYGFYGPSSDYADRKWLSAWNIYDDLPVSIVSTSETVEEVPDEVPE